jgi:hypothetical protein
MWFGCGTVISPKSLPVGLGELFEEDFFPVSHECAH